MEYIYPNLPSRFRGWKIVEEIGQGSFGTVYKITNEKNETAALKLIQVPKEISEIQLLLREFGDDISVHSFYREKVEEYEQEVRMMQSLKDYRHIVRIQDYYMEEREDAFGWNLYIQMEYLKNFYLYSNQKKLSEKDIIRVGIDLCKALQQCEEMKIIHRDLKPDNILVTEEGACKLCDFGVSKNLEVSSSTYSLKGTLSYMAPEVYLGRSYDHRVDLYSLGLVLYRQMNHKREPFVNLEKKLITNKEKEKAFSRRMEGEALPNPVDASEDFAQVILKACAFRAENRYQTAKELEADLQKLLNGTYQKKRFVLTRKGKRIIFGISVAAILFLGVFSWKMYQRYQGIRYSYDSEQCLIIQGKGYLSDIPEEYYGARKIVIDSGIVGVKASTFEGNFASVEEIVLEEGIREIGESAFSFCSALRRISLPDSLEKIDNYAFYGCSELKKLVIPDSVTYIGEAAFYDCSTLTQVVLPQGLTKIPANLFAGCLNLSEVTIPEAVSEIGSCAFLSCEKLEEISLPQNLESVGSMAFEDSLWLRKQKTSLVWNGILIYEPEHGKEIRIMDGLRSIADGVFQNRQELERVILPDSLLVIGRDAFEGCTSLKEVILPDHMNQIGAGAFDHTPWQESMQKDHPWILGDILVSYGGDARKIIVPDGVRIINDYAFAGCESLEEVILPESVTEIRESAFENCIALRKVEIPSRENVLQAENAFAGCQLSEY